MQGAIKLPSEEEMRNQIAKQHEVNRRSFAQIERLALLVMLVRPCIRLHPDDSPGCGFHAEDDWLFRRSADACCSNFEGLANVNLIFAAGRFPQIPAAAALSTLSPGQELASQEAVENENLHVLLHWQPMLRQHAL